MNNNFTYTTQQRECLSLLSQFFLWQEFPKLFLLKGYAGSGKTTIVSEVVNTYRAANQQVVLLAPTGRAAKVLSAYSQMPAYSIHKKIYRQKSISDFSFNLNFNKHTHTLFIVDEASMISGSTGENSIFGSGNLLEDLFEYVYTNDGNSILLVGDTAQLPPVGQNLSPAMDIATLENMGMSVMSYELTNVIRQKENSGILQIATNLRTAISEYQKNFTSFPPLSELVNVDGFEDIKKIDGFSLIETIERTYKDFGREDSLIVTRSNKRATIYNRGIRQQILDREDEINSGDMLIVTKNNYFWPEQQGLQPHEVKLDFIANGDLVKVIKLHRFEDMYNLRFAEMTILFIDYDVEMRVKALVNSIYAETPAELAELSKQLLSAVEEDYIDIGNKRDRWREIKKNQYYNALQIKFGYAVTCHKAQGGQWGCVIIDASVYGQDSIDLDYLRWLYTAITRAQEKVYLLGIKEEK